MSRYTLQRAPNPHAAPPAAITTRRDMFGTMGAMLLLTAAEAGTAKAAELDGHLLSLCDEAVALHDGDAGAIDAMERAGISATSAEGRLAMNAIYARSEL